MRILDIGIFLVVSIVSMINDNLKWWMELRFGEKGKEVGGW